MYSKVFLKGIKKVDQQELHNNFMVVTRNCFIGDIGHIKDEVVQTFRHDSYQCTLYNTQDGGIKRTVNLATLDNSSRLRLAYKNEGLKYEDS